MIEIKNLTKIYKLSSGQMKKLKTKSSTKVAVDNISFKAEQGEILGLLGPNGAGKTTTLRCIATLLKPTDGTVIVDGHDTVKEPEAVRASIGFLTNEIKLDPQFQPDIFLISSEDCIRFLRISLRNAGRNCSRILE